MTVNLTLLVVMGVLFSVGVYLLLERSLTRVLLGLMLLTNGANLLILHTSGVPGVAPLYDSSLDPSEYSDPLPQALVLTSIVISLATTAFLLSMIWRSWILARRDEIQDDLEDRQEHEAAPRRRSHGPLLILGALAGSPPVDHVNDAATPGAASSP